jgi:hypothetical protein
VVRELGQLEDFADGSALLIAELLHLAGELRDIPRDGPDGASLLAAQAIAEAATHGRALQLAHGARLTQLQSPREAGGHDDDVQVRPARAMLLADRDVLRWAVLASHPLGEALPSPQEASEGLVPAARVVGRTDGQHEEAHVRRVVLGEGGLDALALLRLPAALADPHVPPGPAAVGDLPDLASLATPKPKVPGPRCAREYVPRRPGLRIWSPLPPLVCDLFSLLTSQGALPPGPPGRGSARPPGRCGRRS